MMPDNDNDDDNNDNEGGFSLIVPLMATFITAFLGTAVIFFSFFLYLYLIFCFQNKQINSIATRLEPIRTRIQTGKLNIKWNCDC